MSAARVLELMQGAGFAPTVQAYTSYMDACIKGNTASSLAKAFQVQSLSRCARRICLVVLQAFRDSTLLRLLLPCRCLSRCRQRVCRQQRSPTAACWLHANAWAMLTGPLRCTSRPATKGLHPQTRATTS